MKAIMQKLFFFISICYVSGCAFETQCIEDKHLRDRVAACGAGLSDEAVGSLQASYDKHLMSTEGAAGFKMTTKEIIFSEIPERDRLRAYEDYIKCIEAPTFQCSAQRDPFNTK